MSLSMAAFPSQRLLTPPCIHPTPSRRTLFLASLSAAEQGQSSSLPLREIPGGHGLPFFGELSDRLDYFYNQGRDTFFRSRMEKYGSTVFRTNLPPGGFLAGDTRAVVLLDGRSFPLLFDVSKVEKRDVFTGTFMPSKEFTGGHRVLPFIDTAEEAHAKLKRVVFFFLKHRQRQIVPEFRRSAGEMFRELEKGIAEEGKADFGAANDRAAFRFLTRALLGEEPGADELGKDGGEGIVGKWILFQLSPLITLGMPKLVEDLLLRNIRLPPSLVKSDYDKLYRFFFRSCTAVMDEAERMGISREEACHNILYVTCFNSFGGIKIFFPSILKWVGRAGYNLHARLAAEVRSAVSSAGGAVTPAALKRMELTKSVVHEALRIEPPVPLQYGRARHNMVIESHDSAFLVKKGEMLVGYQPFATKDPKIFDRPEEFVADRFVGDGAAGLRHVLWSNGRETTNPTADDKQCAGKDFVNMVSRLLLVELFLRYDSFDVQVGASALGSSVTLTSLRRATF